MQQSDGDCKLEGQLHVHGGRFSGWQQRHCQIVGQIFSCATAKDAKPVLEVNLEGAQLVEADNRNITNNFELMCADKTSVSLRAPSRTELDKWWEALTLASMPPAHDVEQAFPHHWYCRSSKRTHICGVCERSCNQKSIVCEACRLWVHKGCVHGVRQPCKWTTFESIPEDFRFQNDICHQWTTRPTTRACDACTKSIEGPAQFCVWCKQTVHGVCRMALPRSCTLGKHSLSIIRPCDISRIITRVAEVSPLGQYVVSPPRSANPLIVFVNTKSGSNDGVSILRLMRFFLNPAQVFDLSHGGPAAGLRMLQDRPSFRALGCGGDGTIGWILHEADKLNIRTCQLAVLPLGTGNDLARVLGWGGAYNSSHPRVLSEYLDAVEKAKVSLLDRWSVRIVPHEVPDDESDEAEGSTPRPRRVSTIVEDEDDVGELGDDKLDQSARSGHDPGSASSSQQEKTDRESAQDREGGKDARKQKDNEDNEDNDDDDDEPRARSSTADGLLAPKTAAAETTQRSSRRFPRPRFTSVSVFRRSGVHSRSKRQPFKESQRAVRQGYHRAVVLGGQLLEELQALLAKCPEDRVSRRSSELEFMSQSNIGRRESAALGSKDFAHLSVTVASLHSVLHTLETHVSESPNFARDSTSRAQEARERAEALTETINYHKPIWDQMTSGQQRRVLDLMCTATEHILNTLSVFIAAHVGASLVKGRQPRHAQGSETSVLNNYFGIGLDAKIALDFDLLRKHHPEKCRSRLKNKMWYGIMGAREMASPSCKNLHRRIKLECDGKVIKLPKLQGIVILNINSYMGGVDLWGRPSSSSDFTSQSFEDKHLEVIAVRGSSEMAAAKTIPGYNPRRLCQAKSITINIQGNEPVPVQVDGEPWMQTPAVIHINHKNSVQLLSRDKAFQELYKNWEGDASAQRSEDDMICTFQRAVDRVIECVRSKRDVPSDVMDLVASVETARETTHLDSDTFTPFRAVEFVDAVDMLSGRLHEVFGIPPTILGEEEDETNSVEHTSASSQHDASRPRLVMEDDDEQQPCRLTVLDAQLRLLTSYIDTDPSSRTASKRSKPPSRRGRVSPAADAVGRRQIPSSRASRCSNVTDAAGPALAPPVTLGGTPEDKTLEEGGEEMATGSETTDAQGDDGMGRRHVKYEAGTARESQEEAATATVNGSGLEAPGGFPQM